MSAFEQQVGGSHYKAFAIQPAEFLHKNGIGFIEGCVIKYLCRWKDKNGLEDLRKARHFLDLLIEMETNGREGPHRGTGGTDAGTGGEGRGASGMS